MRISFFSEQTTSLHQALSCTRRQLRARNQALHDTVLCCAFDAWKHSKAGLDFAARFQGRWLNMLWCHRALDIQRVSLLGKLLRRSCRDDKLALATRLADELEHAPESSIHAAFQELVRLKKFLAQCQQPLPRLKKEDGSFCESPETVQLRWRRHFANIEAGREVLPEALVETCVQEQGRKGSPQISDVNILAGSNSSRRPYAPWHPERLQGQTGYRQIWAGCSATRWLSFSGPSFSSRFSLRPKLPGTRDRFCTDSPNQEEIEPRVLLPEQSLFKASSARLYRKQLGFWRLTS